MKKSTLSKPTQPVRSTYYAKLKGLWGARFAKPYIILLFIVVIVAILFHLYPEKQLISKISRVEFADQVAREYLIQMLKDDPEDEKFSLLLAEHDISLGDLEKAEKKLEQFIKKAPETEIDWKALWLYYQILLGETYHHPANSSARAQGVQKVRQFNKLLAQGPFTPTKLIRIAEESLGLNEKKVAIAIFERVLTMEAKRPPEAYAHAARLTFAEQEYQMSAKYYFLAQRKSLDLMDRRKYFIKALQTLQSGDLLKEALEAAKYHIADLSDDRTTLIFLAKLALAAGRPKLAENYVRLAIRLKHHT